MQLTLEAQPLSLGQDLTLSSVASLSGGPNSLLISKIFLSVSYRISVLPIVSLLITNSPYSETIMYVLLHTNTYNKETLNNEKMAVPNLNYSEVPL